jgi:hypothetical protein
MALNDEEIKINATKNYAEKMELKKKQLEKMEIQVKGKIIDKRTNKKKEVKIVTEDEIEVEQEIEEHSTMIDIVKKGNNIGFQRGNKPKAMKTRYQERKGDGEMTKEDLRGNTASIFLNHNMNRDKWWIESQAKKEEWRTRNLTKYILEKMDSTGQTIEKNRENNENNQKSANANATKNER